MTDEPFGPAGTVFYIVPEDGVPGGVPTPVIAERKPRVGSQCRPEDACSSTNLETIVANPDTAKLGRLAKKWLKEKVSPIMGDPMQHARQDEREAAAERELKREAADQAERQVLAAVLPPSWNERIEAARPENRAARAAESHRAAILAGDQAHLEMHLSGAVTGVVDATVGVEVDWSSDWRTWRVRLEAADPIAVGGTDFRALIFVVPVEALGETCDLAGWTDANEDRYDPIDFELQLSDTPEPQQWASLFGSAPVQLVADTVVISLPTQDAGSRAVQMDATIECRPGTFDQTDD